ncbi:MAG TPA: DUF6268 family outer membrane beta-barrel protein [Luteolibacter sp.]
MVKITAPAAFLLGSLVSTSAQLVLPSLPELDAARTNVNHSGGMDFEDDSGSLDVSRFELRALLSRPIAVMENVSILPTFDYKATALDFDGAPAGFPIGDETLHSISLSAFAVSMRQGSPWLFGAWARAEMASDFQHVGNDDFTFDVAGGAGYRFNEKFLLAAGGAVANLNGDTKFYPGITFDWVVSDCVRVGMYGPVFLATYKPDENWEFGFRGDSGGDVWNIRDSGGASRSIDLTSYRFGLFASHRLTGELWLMAGVGATFGNEISLTRPDGDEFFDQELDSGLFGQIGLRLKTW